MIFHGFNMRSAFFIVIFPLFVFTDTIVTTHYRNPSDMNNFIDLVDTNTNTLLKSLPVPQGYGGTDIAITRGASGHPLAYVVIRNLGDGVNTFGSQNITVVDVALQSIVAVITENIPTLPNVITVMPNGKKAYVATLSGDIFVIDTATNTIISTPVIGGGNFNDISITPDGTRVFAVSTSQGKVYVINTNTDSQPAGSPISVGIDPNSGSMDPLGQFYYVGNPGSSSISIINTQSLTVSTLNGISVASNLSFVAVSDDNQFLYVPGTMHTVTVIPIATHIPTPFTINQIGQVQIIPTQSGYVYLTTLPMGQSGQGYYSAFLNGNLVVDSNMAGIGDTFGCVTSDNKVYLSNYGSANYIDTSLTLIPAANPTAATEVLRGAFTVGLNWIAAAPNSTNVAVRSLKNRFFLQTELYNEISWSWPAEAIPSSYKIYRDAALTDLLAIVPSNQFIYLDRNREKNTNYSYYLTFISGGIEYALGNCSVTSAP